jgi:hypothetical protein
MVADADAVKAYVTLPKRTLHGLVTEQLAPMASVVCELRLAAKSVSWLAACAPVPASSVQVLVAVQPKRFDPARALVR